MPSINNWEPGPYHFLEWTVSLCVMSMMNFLYLHFFFLYAENKAPLCTFFTSGSCVRGAHCPFRHVRGERTIVCKHWLRHLCKKGDDCEFLHEYDMSKMPICYFFQKFGECNNKDCQYLHIEAEALKIRDCAWYDEASVNMVSVCIDSILSVWCVHMEYVFVCVICDFICL